MLNKSQIIKEFKKKVNKLKKYNDLYFNQDNPSISDSEYDLLKVELIEDDLILHQQIISLFFYFEILQRYSLV